jgi:type II secretory pathway pseudopilin PulG
MVITMIKFNFAFVTVVAIVVLVAGSALAGIPPVRRQATAAAQGTATQQDQAQIAQSQGAQYSGTYSGPANPALAPAPPDGRLFNTAPAAGTTQSPYNWSNDRSWYWTPDNRLMLYGANGWSYPSMGGYGLGNGVITGPGGNSYTPGTSYYTYPGYGNYYYPASASRFPAGNPGMFNRTR